MGHRSAFLGNFDLQVTWYRWAIGNDPKERKLTPGMTPYSISWGLSEKSLRDTIRASKCCRRRCLRELLSKLLAVCAAPDELAWRKVRGIPIWRP